MLNIDHQKHGVSFGRAWQGSAQLAIIAAPMPASGKKMGTLTGCPDWPGEALELTSAS